MSLLFLCIHTGAALLSPNGPTDRPWSSATGRAHYVTADGAIRYVHANVEGVLPADATTDCGAFDLDGDGDVDLHDFSELQNGQ